MSIHRLYTRAQDLQTLQQYFVTLDLTQLDFRSSASLNYYVK